MRIKLWQPLKDGYTISGKEIDGNVDILLPPDTAICQLVEVEVPVNTPDENTIEDIACVMFIAEFHGYGKTAARVRKWLNALASVKEKGGLRTGEL